MKKIVTSVILAMFVSGCGYTTRSQVAEKYKTVYVRQFKNSINITGEANAGKRFRTNYPMIETLLTQSVVDRFAWDGDIKPAREEDADLILKGEVIEFRRDPLSYAKDTLANSDNDEDTVEEYRLNLVAHVVLIDARTNTQLWEEKSLIGDTMYFVSGSNAKPEEEAVKDLTYDLSRRIVERVVEDW